MERKEISEQIGKLNLKIFSANKELEEMELNVKRKKIEIRKYKNELGGLHLKLEEIEIERWKEYKKQKEDEKRQRRHNEKLLKEETNSDYYSQEKKFNNLETDYADYVEKNILPYND